MTTNKSQSSILILATIGVYFGLVLVGATPQIVAQQTATASYHRIKSSDDLYIDSVVKLLDELNRLSISRKFDWNGNTEISIEDLGFDADDLPSFLGSGSKVDPELEFAIENRSLDIARRLLSRKADLGLGDFHSAYPETINIVFASAKSGLKIEFKVNSRDSHSAQQLGNSVAKYFSELSARNLVGKKQLVAENTTSKVEDTKLILSTHLARSSLDSLLGK